MKAPNKFVLSALVASTVAGSATSSVAQAQDTKPAASASAPAASESKVGTAIDELKEAASKAGSRVQGAAANVTAKVVETAGQASAQAQEAATTTGVVAAQAATTVLNAAMSVDQAKIEAESIRLSIASLKLLQFELQMARHLVNESEDPSAVGAGYIVATVSGVAGVRAGIPAVAGVASYVQDVVGLNTGVSKDVQAYNRSAFYKNGGGLHSRAEIRAARLERLMQYAFTPTSKVKINGVWSLAKFSANATVNVFYRAIVQSPKVLSAAALGGIAVVAGGPFVGFVMNQETYQYVNAVVADDIAELEAQQAKLVRN